MAVPVAAAGAAAQIIPALIGRGKSTYNAQDISHSQMYDPFAYQVGNFGAENYKEGREQQARAIDQRAAPQANYQQADADRQRALEARASQATVMGQLMARASGQTPSIAGMQAQQDAQRAIAQQGSLAASARGRGGLANASTTAAGNTANAMSNISNSAQINAANERLQAEQAAFGAASGMRGQDYQSQGQAANQAQFQTGMQLANRGQNDQRALATQQMGHQGLLQEQQGRVAQQGIAAQSHANAQATNAKTEAQNAENKGLIESIGDFFSDERAKYVLSDFTSKFTSFANPGMGGGEGGGMNAGGARMGGHFGGGADQIDAGGGMNTQFGTEWNNSELSGMSGGGMSNPMEGGIMSDDRTKLAAAWDQGHAAALKDVAKVSPDAVPAVRRVQVGRAADMEMGSARKAGQRTGEGPPAKAERAVLMEKFIPKELAESGELAGMHKRAPDEVGRVKPDVAERPGAEVQPLTEEERRQMPWYRGGPQEAPAAAPPPEESGVMARIGNFFSSDFTAKEPLTLNKGGARWGPSADFDAKDPDAFAEPPREGQAQFSPGRGWMQDGADAKSEGKAYLDEEIGARVADDNDREAWNARVADNDRKLATQAEWQRQASDEREPLADDGKRMAPGTADMAKTQPKGEGSEELPMWLRALMTSGRNLNEAQFGSRGAGIAGFRSDFTSKESVDIDEYAKEGYDVGEAPGERDFDADEYDEALSAKVKPYEREGVTRANSRAEHEAEVRARDDRAGSAADEMMAGMRQSLERGPSAKVQADGDPPDLRDAARLRDEALRPENSPMARANRTMKGVPYVYKPQFTPPDQKPGEVNYGFMAQNLKKEPPTATAVKEDAQGMQRVDAMKLLRILGASVADLQQQQDETRLALAKGGRR